MWKTNVCADAVATANSEQRTMARTRGMGGTLSGRHPITHAASLHPYVWQVGGSKFEVRGSRFEVEGRGKRNGLGPLLPLTSTSNLEPRTSNFKLHSRHPCQKSPLAIRTSGTCARRP